MAGEIFISYRRADAAWARLLHAQLRAEGVEAWYDAHVGPGEDWRIATAEALEHSRIFVLLFSANAAQSSDIAKELAAATLGKKLIIPVRLENIAPKGAFLYELASRNWVNAFENTEAKLAELAKGLAHLAKTGARDESVLPFDRSSAGQAAKDRRKPALIAAAAASVLAVSAIAAWFFWPTPHWTVEGSRPFISTLALEDQPAFSPDAKMLAYTSGPDGGPRKIYVRNLAGGDGIKISDDAYDDSWPAWSPDGTHLAYVASKPGEPCRIMVAAVPAGGAREAARCLAAETSMISWQPGTSIVYWVERSGLKGDIVWRLDLDTGARQAIVRKQALRDIITSLHCSPDGKWLVYLLRGEEIIVHDLTSGKDKSLGTISKTSIGFVSLGWTQDSAAVLATSAGRIGGNEIVAHPLGGGAPYSVYTTATKIGDFTAANGLLALVTDISRSNLARASATPASQPDVIDTASGFTWSPSFAPDGTLAFLSDRSGANAVWIKKPGAPPAILLDGGAAPLHRLAFSPDGTKLVVTQETTNTAAIKIVTRAGTTLSSFGVASLGLGLPSWTLDGKGVIVFDRRCRCTWRIDAADPAKRTVFGPPHWVGIAIRKDGTFSTRADKPGIWRIDGNIKQINSTYPKYYEPPLAFRGNQVLVPNYDASGVPQIMEQPLSGGPERLVAYAPGAQREGFQNGFAVDPINGEIIYVASVARDTNIDLLTLARR